MADSRYAARAFAPPTALGADLASHRSQQLNPALAKWSHLPNWPWCLRAVDLGEGSICSPGVSDRRR